MATQRTRTAVLIWAVLLVAGAGELSAQDESDDAPALAAAEEPGPEPAPFTMSLVARLQTRFTYTHPEDQEASSGFGIRRARLLASGDAYGLFDYSIQVELGGSSARLLDAYVVMPVGDIASLWVGQGKAPFSRQFLTSSSRLQFVDRAITDGRFVPGRQQGIALRGRASGFEWTAGVYNGNGINVANDDASYMRIVRAVWAPRGDVPLSEGALTRPPSTIFAMGLAYMENTVGAGDVAAEIRRLGAEAVLMRGGFSTVAELYLERAEAENGLNTFGGYAQAGYLFAGSHEVALRAAMIRPEESSLEAETVEYGTGYSYYLRGHDAKVQADLRRVQTGDDAGVTELRLQLQIAS